MEVKIQSESEGSRCRLSTECPICEEDQIFAVGERRWCRKKVVEKIRKHLKLAHDKNPDEYQIKFTDWF